MIGQENIFQQWLVSLFRLGGWEATIPGVGEYPDVVVFNKPIWIECKIQNIKNNKVERVINQIQRYQTKESIQKTIAQVERYSKKKLQEAEQFLLCAPEKRDIDTFLNKSHYLYISTGFLSIESLHNISDFLVRSNTLNWDKSFPNFRGSIDFSETLTNNCKIL